MKKKDSKKSFKLRFLGEVKNPVIGDVYFDFFTRTYRFKRYIFVEGEADVNYYSTLFSHDLNNIAYIPCGGKSNIVKMYNLLNDSNSRYSILKISHHYIVDKDFNDLYKYNPVHYDKLTLTKYHSYENYAFIDENKKIILQECGLNEEEINEFLVKLNEDFFLKLKEYEILSAMTVHNYITFEKKYFLLENNIKFNDDHTIDINPEFIKNIKEQKKNIFKIKKLRMMYENEFEPQIRKYISMRGHDLEFYFNNMIKKYGKDITLYELLINKDIISKLTIELNTKDDFGENFDTE